MKSVQQKYDEATQRNFTKFFSKGGIASAVKENVSKGQAPHAAFKTLEGVKHHLGIKKTDRSVDGELTLFVAQVTGQKH
jgi:hypothetical protein